MEHWIYTKYLKGTLFWDLGLDVFNFVSSERKKDHTINITAFYYVDKQVAINNPANRPDLPLQNMGQAAVSMPVIMKLDKQISMPCHMSVTLLCLSYSNKVENSTENFPLLWTTSTDVHVAHTLTVACSMQWPSKQFGRYSSSWSGEHASRYAEPASLHTSEHHTTAIQTQLGLKTTWSYCLQGIYSGIKSKYNIQTLKWLSDVTLDFRLKSMWCVVDRAS